MSNSEKNKFTETKKNIILKSEIKVFQEFVNYGNNYLIIIFHEN